MTRVTRSLACAALILVCGSASVADSYHGIDLVSTPKLRLRLGNRAQLRYTLKVPDGESSQGSFDVARYKLALSGTAFENWKFRVQADLAGGSETSEDLLEDAYVVYGRPDRPLLQLRIGQGKVPFGRQQMIDTGRLQFVDTSIATRRFAHGRDVGLTLFGTNPDRTYAYAVGVYNGDGINKDEGDNVDYLAMGRLSVMPLGEYLLDEVDLERRDESRLAIAVSAFTNKVGTEDVEETRVSRGALEIAFRHGGWNLASEFFTESEDALLFSDPMDPASDEEDTDGWYLQVGYLFARRPIEVAGRYAEILRDVANMDTTESGVAFNYYLTEHRYKVQADYRRIAFEDTSGDESTIDRDEIRVQLQFAF